jgi:nitroreductase
MIRDLIEQSRTCRRFQQAEPIEAKLLEDFIDLARLSPCGANLQPLKYKISNKPGLNAKIFKHLAWAGYLTDWEGPQEGERPPAYIIILADTTIKKIVGCDHGIAAQSIMLGACEKGLRGCILGSINRKGLAEDVGLPSTMEVLLVIALGKPAEKVVLEEVGSDGNIEYWRDLEGIHHVPKRKLKDIILK